MSASTHDRTATAGEQVEYEFGDQQNRLLSTLSRRMSIVSWFLLITALILLTIGVSIPQDGGVLHAIFGVLLLLMGGWTQRCARALHRIVRTEHHDIDNLMAALGELSRLYGLQVSVLIIATIGIAVTIFVNVVGMQ